MFEEVVHDFSNSDSVIILMKNCLFPSTRCIHGFMSNTIKKSWTVSKWAAPAYKTSWLYDVGKRTFALSWSFKTKSEGVVSEV